MKRLGILAGVLVLLLVVMFVQRWQKREVVVAGPAETIKLDPEKVTRVKIQNKEGQVELERTGEEWKIVQPAVYPANRDLVKGMLKAMEELKLEDVISSNPATRTTYQVDSTGTAVEIWTGDQKALALVVGKSSADWTHTFVRRADGNDVYRADGVLTYQFNRRPDDWRDKTILQFQEKDIQRVVLSYPKDRKQVAVVRTDSTHWGVQGQSGTPQRGDSLTVARLVGGVAKLMTVNFATPEEAAQASFAQPDFRLAVEAGGTTRAVDFVNVDESKVLARLDGGETVFSLYKSSLGNILKDEKELLTGKKEETAGSTGKGGKKKKA